MIHSLSSDFIFLFLSFSLTSGVFYSFLSLLFFLSLIA